MNPLGRSNLNQIICIQNQMICEPAPKSCTEVTIWIVIYEPGTTFLSKSNNSRYALRSSDMNQKIHKPALKFWSKSNDSWYALNSWSMVPIWITIHEPASKFLLKSNDTCSEVQIWIKRYVNPLWRSNSNDLNCFEVSIRVKWFTIHDPIGALRNSESFCDAMV